MLFIRFPFGPFFFSSLSPPCISFGKGGLKVVSGTKLVRCPSRATRTPTCQGAHPQPTPPAHKSARGIDRLVLIHFPRGPADSASSRAPPACLVCLACLGWAPVSCSRRGHESPFATRHSSILSPSSASDLLHHELGKTVSFHRSATCHFARPAIIPVPRLEPLLHHRLDQTAQVLVKA